MVYIQCHIVDRWWWCVCWYSVHPPEYARDGTTNHDHTITIRVHTMLHIHICVGPDVFQVRV